jgi:hypothetical protein
MTLSLQGKKKKASNTSHDWPIFYSPNKNKKIKAAFSFSLSQVYYYGGNEL